MVGYRRNPKVNSENGVTFYVLPEGWREITVWCSFHSLSHQGIRIFGVKV